MALGSLGQVSYDIVAHDQTATAAGSSQKNLMAIGGALTGVGVASIAMTKDIKNSFLEFDTAMTEVEALGGVTEAEFGQMRDAALDLSKSFPITATDVADAMYLMISVGYDYQTMMKTIPDAAALATAGSMEMAEATDAIISVMGIYKDEAYSSAEITKTFANAVGLGKYEMGDFMTEIMKNMGVASQLGISLSDLASYNVALQSSFTNAEEAGTSLNRMLIQLTDPSTVEKLAGMGVAVTDNEGHFRDLTDIMGDLDAALSGVDDDAERMAIVTDLFGTYGQRAAIAIMDQTEELPELKDKMSDLNLIVEQTNTKLEGTSQQLQIATNKTDAAKIAFGEAMAPAMEISADAVSGLADVLEDLPDPLQTVGGLGIYAAQGLGAIGPALMGIAAMKSLGLGGVITSIGTSLSGLGATLSGAASTAGAAIGGSIITGIAGGIALGLAGVWVLLETGVLDAISGIGRAIESSPVGSMIMDAMKVVLAPIGSLGAGIIALVQGDFARIPEVMVEPFNQAGEAIGRNIDRIKDAFSGIGTTVAGGVQALGNAVQGMINSFSGMGSIAGYAGSAFAGIGGAFNSMAGQVRGVFSQMFSSIQGMIGSVAGGFYAAGANIITSMVNGIVAASGGIVTAIANALNQVRALFPFSPAKEGPLAETPNWGTWMSSGMESAGPEVAAAASTNLAAPAAAGVAGGMTASGGVGAGGGGSGGSVNIAAGAIVINGAGQNAEEIANQVIAKLGQQMAGKRQQKGYRTTT